MEKNNLFAFATSELSQDAFICWLLNFAHEDHLNENRYLTECARKLLRKMVPEESQHRVNKISRQYNKTDVLLEVNNKYSVIIEDKTFSNTHDDQINRYKNTLIAEGRENIKSVYFKIVEQPFEENADISISRGDLLEIFKEYVDDAQNNILRDYYEYLLEIEKDVNAYKSEEILTWRDEYDHVYKGFFTHLVKDNIIQTKEDNVVNGHYNWCYVSNPRGGFWCLWWFSFKSECLDKCNLSKYIDELYLEIEDNQIVIKMVGNSEQAQDARRSLYEYCKSIMPKFDKKAFRVGKHMTVGYIDYDEKNYREKIKAMEDLMRGIGNGQYIFKTEE